MSQIITRTFNEVECKDHRMLCIFNHDVVADHKCVLVCFNCRTCSHGYRWPHCCGVIEVPEVTI